MQDQSEEIEAAKSYVRQLLRGRIDPIQVPKNLISRVNHELDSRKGDFINQGNIDKVRKVQRIQLELIQSEQRQWQYTNTVKQPSVVSSRNRAFVGHDAEEQRAKMEKIINDLIEGKPFEQENAPIIPQLINFTKEKINNFIFEKNLPLAQEYENVLKALPMISVQASTENRHISKRNDIEKLLRRAKRNLEKEQQDYQKYLNEFDEQSINQRNEVNEKYSQQFNDFDDETNKGPPERYLNRRSQRYLNLKKMEEAMISSRKFEQAEAIKEELLKLEAKEKDYLQKKFFNDRQRMRDKMYSDYENNIHCLDEQFERKRTKIIQDYELSIKNKEKAIENLKGKLADAERCVSNNCKPIVISDFLPPSEQTQTQHLARSETRNSGSSPTQRSPTSYRCNSSNSTQKVSISTQTIRRYRFPSLR